MVSVVPPSEKYHKAAPNPGAPGLGLRKEHYSHILENRPRIAEWFEVISENYFSTQGRPIHILEKVRADFPIAMHGVSMSVGSTSGISIPYLKKIKRLAERIEPFLISDHLCWSNFEGRQLHDLLPLPFTDEAIRIVSQNVMEVQEYLNRTIALENVSTYLIYSGDEMTEWDFINAICEKSGCKILLDVNNIVVNARNHKFNPVDFIDGIRSEYVAQFHIAGHSDMQTFLFDTHSTAVTGEVWELFRLAQRKFPDAPFLLERDGDIPSFGDLELELEKSNWKQVSLEA